MLLRQRGWTPAELADEAEIQAPVLLSWLESDLPAPDWLRDRIWVALGLIAPTSPERPQSKQQRPHPATSAQPNRPQTRHSQPPQTRKDFGKKPQPEKPKDKPAATPPPSPPLKPTQADMLRALLRKKGWDEETFKQKAGKPLERLTAAEARSWITDLTYATKGQPDQSKLQAFKERESELSIQQEKNDN
jgi:hypothetical protein